MRLVIILMTIGFLQVSAAGYGQRITLSEKNTSLEQVINKIRTQAGYDFLGDTRLIRAARPVSINVKDAPIEKVLEICFAGQPLTYSVNDKIVVITEKERSILDNLTKSVQTFFQQDSVSYVGKVLDERGQPLPGATVTVKGFRNTRSTNSEGVFVMYGPRQGTFVISFVGYNNREIKVDASMAFKPFTVKMVPASKDLKEVEVVSTGYQDLPKERVTGSFEVITAKQLEHSTSPNVLRRLEGITTSIDFRNDLRPTNSAIGASRRIPILNSMTIRGKNTLQDVSRSGFADYVHDNASGRPLVVIDGIASSIDIERLNPDEVESITILKDAAAASIWGARAANGVIVVKTKRGSFNKPVQVSFNSNINVTDKIDLFYRKSMTIPEFIEAERHDFNRQFPIADYPVGSSNPLGDVQINRAPDLVSPVYEILNKERKGTFTPAQAEVALNALKGNDIRNDYTNYFLRSAITQRYNLSVSGGSRAVAYWLSGGYLNDAANTRGTNTNGFNLSYKVTVQPVKNLSLSADIGYMHTNLSTQFATETTLKASYEAEPFLPYTRLVDDQGNPAVVPRDYRPEFLDLLEQTYGQKILNTRWTPLEDYKEGSTIQKAHIINLIANADYTFNPVFKLNVKYNLSKAIQNENSLAGSKSYYMRSRINLYTDPVTFNRAIPLGSIYSSNNTMGDKHSLNAVLNANKNWNDKHEISAIAGIDVNQDSRMLEVRSNYGFNERSRVINDVSDYNTSYPLLFNNGSSTGRIPRPIPSAAYTSKVRAYSLFSNAAYTYNQRYTISGSIRNDASSNFGTATNSWRSPFFSTGLAWNIDREAFYKLEWLPVLKLRATYGYNGNANEKATSNATINYPTTLSAIGLPFASLTRNSVNNKNLRPERTAVLNFGLDFGLKNNRISGSVEYYEKQTEDLISQSFTDPTIGVPMLDYNVGNLFGNGVEVKLNTINIQSANFSWSSSFLFAYNRVKITKLLTEANKFAAQNAGVGGYSMGYDINRLFAWRWAGLDPETGDPRVFINGKAISVNGSQESYDIISKAPVSEIRYMGSSTPVYSGSFQNMFNYKGFSASFLLMYNLGYYRIRPLRDIVQYFELFGGSFYGNKLQGAEYANRWKKSGDEAFTNVPSQADHLPAYSLIDRDLMYVQSDINIIKADHIRLQNINLGYTFKKAKGFIKNPRVYGNVTNLGILWRANKIGVDPDIDDYPNPRQYSLGLSANF